MEGSHPFSLYKVFFRCYNKSIILAIEEVSLFMGQDYKRGVAYAIAAYCIWGFLPIYWRQLHHVDSLEILASRFIWSAVFVFLLLLFTKKFGLFVQETKEIFSHWDTAIRMIVAAVTISFNWGIFIWAVEVGRIVETSMGYYINPLVSVLFGVVFLRERLDRLQCIAVLCAAFGIAVVIVQNGSLPWVSVSLAVTFALYSLLKKVIRAQALTSIMLETLLISPVMLYHLYTLSLHGGNAYQNGDLRTLCFLVGAGVATATPLLLFTACAKLMPLYMVGFLQYLSPTITLLIGIFIYGEAFTMTHVIAFSCIWLGLIFFTVSQIRKFV